MSARADLLAGIGVLAGGGAGLSFRFGRGGGIRHLGVFAFGRQPGIATAAADVHDGGDSAGPGGAGKCLAGPHAVGKGAVGVRNAVLRDAAFVVVVPAAAVDGFLREVTRGTADIVPVDGVAAGVAGRG